MDDKARWGDKAGWGREARGGDARTPVPLPGDLDGRHGQDAGRRPRAPWKRTIELEHRLVLLAAVVLLASGHAPRASLSQDALDRSLAQGVDPDLIYLVDLPGFELADLSAGVVGDDGFGATYWSQDGRVELRAHHSTSDGALLASTRLMGAEPWTAPVRCEHDEVGSYRSAGGRHEYAVLRAGHLIWLNCPVGLVDRAVLKAAMAGVRQVTWKGSRTPPPRHPPVRRGDLPTTGDGAPVEYRGVGG
ncbi:hypothetical protein GCM10022252_78400 [Streptosporangium oxazolinicum]|uniref:Uncharacterized protein n=1 Tax=Streptosporangium oxazolinicum TaxID=909287 RepID=A0ABP8BMP2_9ACTN